MTELITGLHNLKTKHQACVLAIGNFDGLHQGHQAIIQTLQKEANHVHLPTCVMLFEPYAQEFFLEENAPARLMRLREKIAILRHLGVDRIIRHLGVDRIICLHFNKHLAAMPAKSFVKEILVDKLGIRVLVVGDDFRFGKGQQGDFSCLKQLGKQYGFKVCAPPTVMFESKGIGSSWVRMALKEGKFALAKALLARPFMLSGRVVYGDQRGRLLGFPTANIALHRIVSPLNGVFIVRVYGLGKKNLIGVAHCGQRPTINDLKGLLEVYLFDFDQNIYGHWLEIEFLKKIRDEKNFLL